MSHNILKRLAFVGCLALAITAYAQDRGDDRYHSEARSESWTNCSRNMSLAVMINPSWTTSSAH